MLHNWHEDGRKKLQVSRKDSNPNNEINIAQNGDLVLD